MAIHPVTRNKARRRITGGKDVTGRSCRIAHFSRSPQRFLNPGMPYSEVQLERNSGRPCCTPGKSVQHSSSGVHSSINAQCVTWFEEEPEAICMLNVQSFPLSTIFPTPVVSEGEPTGTDGERIEGDINSPVRGNGAYQILTLRRMHSDLCDYGAEEISALVILYMPDGLVQNW